MSKILTVFGATGNQGGSVIRAVLADPSLSREFKIRAVTRNVNKPAAKALSHMGVEVISADMSTPAPALQGAHTVFLMTNFWESMSKTAEVAQGKAVADAAREAGVRHLIFSSLIDVAAATQGRLRNVVHFDGKAEVERYIRGRGVPPATFFLPGMFMGSLLEFMRKGDDGVATLAWPVGNTAKVPVIDIANDTGKYAKAAIKHFPSSVGKQILGAVEYLSPQRIVSEYTHVTGRPARYVQVTDEEFKEAASASQELLETVKLLDDDAGYYNGQDLGESLALLEEKPTSWVEFLERHRERWL